MRPCAVHSPAPAEGGVVPLTSQRRDAGQCLLGICAGCRASPLLRVAATCGMMHPKARHPVYRLAAPARHQRSVSGCWCLRERGRGEGGKRGYPCVHPLARSALRCHVSHPAPLVQATPRTPTITFRTGGAGWTGRSLCRTYPNTTLSNGGGKPVTGNKHSSTRP